jgi:hypothetical protein
MVSPTAKMAIAAHIEMTASTAGRCSEKKRISQKTEPEHAGHSHHVEHGCGPECG